MKITDVENNSLTNAARAETESTLLRYPVMQYCTVRGSSPCRVEKPLQILRRHGRNQEPDLHAKWQEEIGRG